MGDNNDRKEGQRLGGGVYIIEVKDTLNLSKAMLYILITWEFVLQWLKESGIHRCHMAPSHTVPCPFNSKSFKWGPQGLCVHTIVFK